MYLNENESANDLQGTHQRNKMTVLIRKIPYIYLHIVCMYIDFVHSDDQLLRAYIVHVYVHVSLRSLYARLKCVRSVEQPCSRFVLL